MRRGRTRWWVAALAGLTLFFASGLTIAYFNMDVGMAQTQETLFRFLTGLDGPQAAYVLPYAAGVAAGVLGFFFPPGRGRPSPLEMEFSAYEKDAQACIEEKTRRNAP